jgi:hypothetical protein
VGLTEMASRWSGGGGASGRWHSPTRGCSGGWQCASGGGLQHETDEGVRWGQGERTKTAGARSSLGGGEMAAATSSSAPVVRAELQRPTLDNRKKRRGGGVARGSGGNSVQMGGRRRGMRRCPF